MESPKAILLPRTLTFVKTRKKNKVRNCFNDKLATLFGGIYMYEITLMNETLTEDT